MENLIRDLKFGLRSLLKARSFLIISVIALAIGIGANTAIFSVVNSILIKPLPYRDSDRLVMLYHHYPKLELKASVSAVGYNHYRKNVKSFESLGAFTGWAANLTGIDVPERLTGGAVTHTFFSTLGVSPARGRTFQPDEEVAGKNRVVVLTDGLWKRRFGGAPDMVGRSIMLNGENYTVIGIMHPDFRFGSEFGQEVEIYTPAVFTPPQLDPNNWGFEFLTVLARLKPGVSLEASQTELNGIATGVRRDVMEEADPTKADKWTLLLEDFREIIVGDIRPALRILMLAVGLVLLIACANVANLQLARASSRQREMALRSALGAGRGRIIRQLLTESLLLAVIGGVCGLLLAWAGIKLLVAISPENIPRTHEIGIDSMTLAFTIGVSILTGLLFGLAPAWQTSRTDLHETLKEGGRTGASFTRGRVRSLLVVGEVAVALALLIGAGLLIRSFLKVQEVAPGFRQDKLLIMQLSLPDTKYPEPADRDRFYQSMIEKVRAIPGVQAAGINSSVPMSGSNSSASFSIEGREVARGEMMPWGNRWFAGPTYFQTMGIPLIRGRYFEERDAVDAPLAAIIDETMARKFWPNEDPIGKRISFSRDDNGERAWREIVGIVGHVKQKGLEGESPVQYYIPQRQMPSGSVYLAIRSMQDDPSSLAGVVRSAIQSIDRELPVFKVRTMEKVVSDSLMPRRFAMILLGSFALIALLLAAVGLYGIMSYSVVQRTHEIGIRMALGARASSVLGMVIKQGMLLTLAGLVLGLTGAFALAQIMSSLVFGIGTTDPLTFSLISVSLLLVAFVASYIPARRATRVDPMIALRYE
ncbi:MAG: ABC transporter permease [Acidobacteriota bacterium]|nr:MAG: ABC transporter permease [Acidobacteriota bacterium]